MTSEEQFAPLIRFQWSIATRLGLLFEFGRVDRIATISASDLSGYDAVGLKLGFTTSAEDAEAMASTLFGAARHAGARCLVFDGDDDLCVLWPRVIEACDAYIKKHRFADLTDYLKPYQGKSNLTDYCVKKYGVSFSENIIPETQPLREEDTAKIVLGWNIGLDDKIDELAGDLRLDVFSNERAIDISSRAAVGPDNWIHGMRNDAVKAISALDGTYKVHAPTDRVSQQQYYDEMLNSRITVSPFGYGELCWRDFEAILCGSVLVKPDMSHLETWPDLFVPGETYLPVAWDYSDLEEVCSPVLNDEEARLRLAGAARAKLLEGMTADKFIERLQGTMKAAGLL